jgi:hypothetical protein
MGGSDTPSAFSTSRSPLLPRRVPFIHPSIIVRYCLVHADLGGVGPVTTTLFAPSGESCRWGGDDDDDDDL